LGVAVLDAQGVNVLGTLPSREILLAQTTGRLRALLIGLVSVLQGPIRGLAYVLQARARQPGGGAA
jgi:large subunit ribosomal protein L10